MQTLGNHWAILVRGALARPLLNSMVPAAEAATMGTREHDKLFKGIYSHPESAAAHFETFLPPPIVAGLDLGNAELVPGTFVDDELPERRTDLLYRIPRRKRCGGADDPAEVLLYVIFEHQSSVDRMMAFRMCRYAVRIWERWLADNIGAKELPPILPLVLYHGERRWSAPCKLTDLTDLRGFDDATLAALHSYLLDLEFMLHDLGEIPDDALPRHPSVRLTLMLFKHGRKPELLELLADCDSELRSLAASGQLGLRAFGFLVQYILSVNVNVTREALGETLAAAGREVQEMAMTEYEKLIDEGRQEGLKKGRQEAKVAVARRLLARGMSIEEVAELAELSVDEVRKLSQ